MSAFPFADRALSRRLERAEALSNARFVESRARVFPASGACWTEVAGAYALFDGAASPVTQTFGLGMSQLPTAGDMDSIEAFFTQRVRRFITRSARWLTTSWRRCSRRAAMRRSSSPACCTGPLTGQA